MILSLDTETTGLDPYHETVPYYVTTCNSEGVQKWWEWDVDPFTRMPTVPKSDLIEIRNEIAQCEILVFHNGKYDIQVLENLRRLGIAGTFRWKWPWERIHDTSISAHLLSSCQPKGLTTQSLIHLGINLQPYEDAIKEATQKARRIVNSKKFKEAHGEWFMSKADKKGMPSAGGEPWKGDMWVLKALIRLAPEFLPDWGDWKAETTKKRRVPGEGWITDIIEGDPIEEHPWNTQIDKYAHPDSEATVLLHEKHQSILQEKGLINIYNERRKLTRVTYIIEDNGVTLNKDRLEKQKAEYALEAQACEDMCIDLAPEGTTLDKLPLSGASNQLKEVMFEGFKLPVLLKTAKGGPSLKADVLKEYRTTLEPESDPYDFVGNLLDFRKRRTAISYMTGYAKYWMAKNEEVGTYILHPSLNPVGTNTLRWTSSHPNEQNISKKEGFNLRYSFGPDEGRLWASLDYNNIELRIPAYESGEEVMIEIFEKATEAPFFGSYHLMNASIVFAEEFWPLAEKKGAFKKKYPELYQRIKNFGFALSYGAVMKQNGWGTADKAAGIQGAHKLVANRLQKHSRLNKRWIDEANATGFVETIPDVEIDPLRGYPIECKRTNYGRISPTIPLNYHVQSTCMWVIFRAMLKVQDYLDQINKEVLPGDEWKITLQVHDELVLDFPKKPGWEYHIRHIAKIMESCGNNINIPLTVGCEIHDHNWSEGYDLAV